MSQYLGDKNKPCMNLEYCKRGNGRRLAENTRLISESSVLQKEEDRQTHGLAKLKKSSSHLVGMGGRGYSTQVVPLIQT